MAINNLIPTRVYPSRRLKKRSRRQNSSDSRSSPPFSLNPFPSLYRKTLSLKYQNKSYFPKQTTQTVRIPSPQTLENFPTNNSQRPSVSTTTPQSPSCVNKDPALSVAKRSAVSEDSLVGPVDVLRKQSMVSIIRLSHCRRRAKWNWVEVLGWFYYVRNSYFC